MSQTAHAFDATMTTFETDVLQKSMQTPVLVDFWAAWCGPCKALKPVLEKLATDYHGAFVLARIDTEAEPEIAQAFQIRSIPTVYLIRNGQPVDGFQGALPETQVREFLKHHGIEPAAANTEVTPEAAAPAAVDPHAEVVRLRKLAETEPDKPAHKLDLALALLHTGAAHEAEHLLDALPANLATDDRTLKARARLGFAGLLENAPAAQTLETAIQSNPGDLHARHLLGVRRLIEGDADAALEQFMEMLRRDRTFGDGLARKSLIDAFRIIDDEDLIGRYRRQMSALLLS